jgi:hypothetical protein
MDIKKKIYILSGIISIIFLAVVFWFVPFLIGQIRQASSDFIRLQSDLITIQKTQNDVEHQKKEYQAIKPEIERNTNVFLEKSKAISFIIALEEIARQSGNQTEIQVMDQSSKESIVFQVSLWGGFVNLIKFMSYLDNLTYLNQVEVVKIQRINQDNAEKGIKAGEISSVLQIRAYFAPEKK